MKTMKSRKWSDLTPAQRRAVLVSASVQLSLAAAAWVDLAKRPESQVNGRKSLWAVGIGLNFLGPIMYFTRGIRR